MAIDLEDKYLKPINYDFVVRVTTGGLHRGIEEYIEYTDSEEHLKKAIELLMFPTWLDPPPQVRDVVNLNCTIVT